MNRKGCLCVDGSFAKSECPIHGDGGHLPKKAIEEMLAELVEARAVLHELLPYCRTHVSQESFRDAINRAQALLEPKQKAGRTP